MIRRKQSSSVPWALLAALLLLPGGPASAFHFPWDQGHDTCRPDAPPPPPDDCDKCDATGSPFVVATGMFRTSAEDLLIPGPMPLQITRVYHGGDGHQGMLGRGWLFNYGIRIIEVTDGLQKTLILRRENGQRDRFAQGAAGAWIAPPDVPETLVKKPDGTFELTERERTVLTFDSDGILTAITDRNGNSVSLAYDDVGFLVSATDDSGRALVLTRGANGKVASITDPAGRVVRYDYDANGSLISVTDPAGGVTRYTYDSKGFLTQIMDARGSVVAAMTYDSLGRLNTYTEQQETYRLTYSPATKKVVETDSQGRTRTLFFNDAIRVTKVIDQLGKTRERAYDAASNAVSETDAAGNVTRYTYDARGNQLTAVDPLGRVTQFTYDPVFDQLTSITDPLGNRTTFEHDARGNLTRSVDAEGNATSYTYDSRGLLTGATDPNGYTRTLIYDTYGNLTQESDPLGRVATYSHDIVGNLLSHTDPDSQVFQFEYDPLGRLVTLEDPAGNQTQFEYAPRCPTCKPVDLITAIVESGGARTTYEYDAFGRMTRVQGPLGQSYRATYDRRGNLLSSTDALGRLTSYAYDALNRLIQVTKPGGVVTKNSYDSNGNIIGIVDPAGRSTTYTFDALNRLLSVVSPDTGQVVNNYDAAGRLVGRTDARANNLVYDYDGLGRRTAIHFPDSTQDVTFRYDETAVANGRGRMTGMTDASGETAFSYDGPGRMTELRTTRLGTSYVTRYEYRPGGATQRVVYPSGIDVRYQFDSRGLVSGVTARLGAAEQVLASDIVYDAAGNRTSTLLGNGLTETRRYDAEQRVQEIATPGVDDVLYSYDTVGNVLALQDLAAPAQSQTFNYNARDELVSATGAFGSIGFTYDAVGNRLSRTQGAQSSTYSYNADRLDAISGAGAADYSFDPAGNTTSDGRFQYEYGADGRLHRVLEDGAEVAEYTFNGFGQRVVKIAGSSSIAFHYDNEERLIEETTPDGRSLRAYVYLPDGSPLAMVQDGQIFYYHLDRLATPRKLTDALGAQVWSADIQPFGEASVSGSVEQPLRFPGQYFDAETGLSYNYYRDYDPEIGRYLEPDPLGLDAGGNLYVYTANNPVRYVDPSGLLTLWEAVKHYFGIGGRGPVTVPFKEVDLGLKPRDFPGFMTQVNSLRKKTASKPVDLKVSKDVGDLVYGHVTFRLTGTITSDKCKWSFSGQVGAFNDTFDFNALPWGTRTYFKEIITRLFGALPAGQPYEIIFSGKRAVSDGGKW